MSIMEDSIEFLTGGPVTGVWLFTILSNRQMPDPGVPTPGSIINHGSLKVDDKTFNHLLFMLVIVPFRYPPVQCLPS